ASSAGLLQRFTSRRVSGALSRLDAPAGPGPSAATCADEQEQQTARPAIAHGDRARAWPAGSAEEGAHARTVPGAPQARNLECFRFGPAGNTSLRTPS